MQVYQKYFGEEAVPKGTKFSEKLLGGLNYQNLDPAEWTKEEETNELIKRLITQLQY
jgi:DNA-directed RNA polymerase subunit beta